MTPQDEESTGLKEVRIVRGRVDSLSIYEVTETELDALERGSPYSIYLNFGIFLVTLGMSFLTSLLTVDIESLTTLVVFLVLTVIGNIGGALLIILWYGARKEVGGITKRIRARIAETEPSAGVHAGSVDDAES
ncbi:MAG: hypothetical protein F4107_14445 [Gemmatimonadetes bacterium]|nr:hypothetical protein [Gemmatimonadota bacterium]MYD12517.1 hypothetical protein [Gemmatimonadota bacterium]MYI67118.1 hypothetical protein [Gemmatimonadota bacterium]